jgi:hypothetical protein
LPNQADETKLNQSKPIQTKPIQTKPIQMKPNETVSAENSFEHQLAVLARVLHPNAAQSTAHSGQTMIQKTGFDTPKTQDLNREATVLACMLREMEVFLSEVAGLEALPIVLMFKQITKLEQLKEELPAYFNLIDTFTNDKSKHVLQLEKILSNS